MSSYSALPDNTPLLVGAGVVMQKEEDPQRALEPLALMIRALENAERDAGVSGLLREADSVQVPQGFWEYGNPGRRIAAAVGAAGARSTLAEIGVLQQTLLTRACEAIVEGAEQVALIAGGEARWRTLCAAKAGVELKDDIDREEEMPDEWLQPGKDISAPLESERGLVMPVDSYAVVESALRHARGLSIRQHREEIAALTAAMSGVAAANEDAWEREEYTAEQVLADGRENAMLAFPYAKLHASQWNVDQAAGLILCSAGAARRLGVAEERWIFPLAAAETNFMQFLSEREHLHRSPGARLAAEAVLELAELSPAELDFLELYSCFPAALQAHALELGFPCRWRSRPPSPAGCALPAARSTITCCSPRRGWRGVCAASPAPPAWSAASAASSTSTVSPCGLRERRSRLSAAGNCPGTCGEPSANYSTGLQAVIGGKRKSPATPYCTGKGGRPPQ